VASSRCVAVAGRGRVRTLARARVRPGLAALVSASSAHVHAQLGPVGISGFVAGANLRSKRASDGATDGKESSGRPIGPRNRPPLPPVVPVDALNGGSPHVLRSS
jgi:hypothetical protein